MKTLYEKMRDNRHKVEAAKAKRRWVEDAKRQQEQAQWIRQQQSGGAAFFAHGAITGIGQQFQG